MLRHPLNPVLTAAQAPYPATLVFNAGVLRHAGRYVMVFRNDHGRTGDPRFDGTNLGLATSPDGVKWTVEPKPILTAHGICAGVATTEDFRKFHWLSVSAPDSRNLVLFPKRLAGRFMCLERPFPVYMRAQPEAFPIWWADSPALVYWGNHRPVLGPDEVPFANAKIGPAAPPIETSRGWLVSIHAVHTDKTRALKGWESASWHKTYHAGLILLDRHEPWKVIGLRRTPLLAPEAEYELDGFRGSVIFPTGMVLEDSGEVKLYYGAADTSVALATAHVDDLVASCTPLR